MINSLSIKNIALIDSLDIEFTEGLNIVSGETGAGKSILIDSINFVLGDRADKSLIRYGEVSARVELVFQTEERADLKNLLEEELGIDYDTTVVVSRVLSTNGRGDCRINGRPVTLSSLKKFVATLVDLHGQHENQSLMVVQNHIRILDNYSAGADVLLSKYKKSLSTYKTLTAERAELLDSDNRARQIELLEFQRDEIDKAELWEGEEEELVEKRARFNNMEHILTSVEGAANSLDGDGGAMFGLTSANALLSSVVRYDHKLGALTERLDSVKIELNDVTEELKTYLENADYDPKTQEKVEKRLEFLRGLKRKYGKTVADILKFLQTVNVSLEKLYGAEERAAELDTLIQKSEQEAIVIADQLHALRTASAINFEKEIVSHLRDLGMTNTTFRVDISHSESVKGYDANGADKVEFLISPNKGEPLKPLQKIASGGELSRFMLALKNITAELDSIDTLIFDEIDTGISGNVAKVVAQKLANIAKSRQVLVVTHLPQIAAMSDRHFLIEKSIKAEKTITEMSLLNEKTLLLELVRLTGGVADSEISIQHVSELRRWAQEYKKTI